MQDPDKSHQAMRTDARAEGAFPPPPEDREDGMEVLAFHRGRWRHVKWSAEHQGWIRGYGGTFIRDSDRAFAPLPDKPEGAHGFFDFQEPI